jgi:hypothetical protein
MASDATKPFNPPLENLRYLLLLYAASTREFRDDVAIYRDKARRAVALYRAFMAQERAAQMRAAA